MLRRTLRKERKRAAERAERRVEMLIRLGRQTRREPGFTPYPRAEYAADRTPMVAAAVASRCAWPQMAPLTRREREAARDAARKAQSQRRS